ncbi:hypothetical protein QJS66_19305 [Kocuria rhizophila]|nr:hypothetical protein QJS66_19305 [Kocuria rhizophila]
MLTTRNLHATTAAVQGQIRGSAAARSSRSTPRTCSREDAQVGGLQAQQPSDVQHRRDRSALPGLHETKHSKIFRTEDSTAPSRSARSGSLRVHTQRIDASWPPAGLQAP